MATKLINKYCPGIARTFESAGFFGEPWEVARALPDILASLASAGESLHDLGRDVYAHSTADIHPTAIVDGPAVISAGVTVGPHAVLRGGVYLGDGVHIGAGVEIKQSVIGSGSAVAHLNYVGNSVVGDNVNIEAGAVVANHFNEKLPDKRSIDVVVGGKVVHTGTKKFGALIGDNCKIGANAVTSPGTVLPPSTVVGRLQLVDQNR